MNNRVKWLINQIECEDRSIRELERKQQEINGFDIQTWLDDFFKFDKLDERRRVRTYEEEHIAEEQRPKRFCGDETSICSSSAPTTAVAAPSTPPERLTKSNAVDTASFRDEMEGLSGEQGFHARGEVFGE